MKMATCLLIRKEKRLNSIYKYGDQVIHTFITSTSYNWLHMKRVRWLKFCLGLKRKIELEKSKNECLTMQSKVFVPVNDFV